jgi:hypothetical protein
MPKNTSNKNFVVRIFEWLSASINGGERAIVDLVSAVIPYLVPIIPAWLMYYHAEHDMGFSRNIAVTAGVVVEGLGLASVATAVRFFLYNRRFKKDAKNPNPNQAPLKAAMAVYGFYVVIVMLVNVIMEATSATGSTRSGWTILAIALFSLLSFPSGLLVALRTGFAEMLEEKESARHNNQNNNAPGKPAKKVNASDKKAEILQLLDTHYQQTGEILKPSQISARLNLDNETAKGYISTETSKWKKEKGINPLGF